MHSCPKATFPGYFGYPVVTKGLSPRTSLNIALVVLLAHQMLFLILSYSVDGKQLINN